MGKRWNSLQTSSSASNTTPPDLSRITAGTLHPNQAPQQDHRQSFPDKRSQPCLPQPPPHLQPPQPLPPPRWPKVRSRNPQSNSPAGAATTANAASSLARSCKRSKSPIEREVHGGRMIFDGHYEDGGI